MGLRVAPRVGAWIETASRLETHYHIMSLPVWERGLKHTINNRPVIVLFVAPRVGAWIETLSEYATGLRATSLPVWERGLKRRWY